MNKYIQERGSAQKKKPNWNTVFSDSVRGYLLYSRLHSRGGPIESYLLSSAYNSDINIIHRYSMTNARYLWKHTQILACVIICLEYTWEVLKHKVSDNWKKNVFIILAWNKNSQNYVSIAYNKASL